MEGSAPESLSEAWDTAIENAGRGLRISATKTAAGTVFSAERAEGMATSILADPEFLKQAARWVGTGKFHLGVPDLDHLLIWDPASADAAAIERKVLSHRHADAVNFDSVVLCVDHGAVTVKRS